MTNLILPRRKLLIPSFAAGLAAASPAMGHNGGPPMATEAEVSRVVEQNRHVALPWGTLPSDPSLAMFMMAKMAMVRVGSSEAAALRPQDVFAATTYAGTNFVRTLTTGVDLATLGGLVWTKNRTKTYNHELTDTVQAAPNRLMTNLSDAGDNASDVTGFTTTGINLRYNTGNGNEASSNYVAWSFRRAAKFFDVVTYAGNSTAGRTIAHGLGTAPGLIIVKMTNATRDWYVYHVSAGAANQLVLNQALASGASSNWNSTAPTSAVFSLGGGNDTNGSGNTYVAYLFAHDADPSGVVQCGSFTVGGAGTVSVNLGWKPQYLMFKWVNTTGAWCILDTARGWGAGSEMRLFPNLNASETGGADLGAPTVSGFDIAGLTSGDQCVYLAIREPV